MKESDFIFDRIEGGKYCDYWFRVTEETQKELTDRSGYTCLFFCKIGCVSPIKRVYYKWG